MVEQDIFSDHVPVRVVIKIEYQQEEIINEV